MSSQIQNTTTRIKRRCGVLQIVENGTHNDCLHHEKSVELSVAVRLPRFFFHLRHVEYNRQFITSHDLPPSPHERPHLHGHGDQVRTLLPRVLRMLHVCARAILRFPGRVPHKLGLVLEHVLPVLLAERRPIEGLSEFGGGTWLTSDARAGDAAVRVGHCGVTGVSNAARERAQRNGRGPETRKSGVVWRFAGS